MRTADKESDIDYIKQGLTQSEYVAIHVFLNKNYSKVGKCQKCLTISARRTEWALKRDRYYSRDISDYDELCPSCHRKQDYKESVRNRTSNRMRDGFVSGEYKSRLPVYSRHNHPTNTPVLMMCPITDKVLKRFDSVTQACLEMSGKITGAIQNNINGLSTTAYKHKWKYENEKDS